MGSIVPVTPLTWVDRAGGIEANTAIRPDSFSYPRLSSNDQRLLVLAHGDVRVYDLATGPETRVTTDGTAGPYAAWSPDNRTVAYSSTRSGSAGRADIWVQPADGSGAASQLTQRDGMVHVDTWAPDGRTLVAHHHTPTGGIDQLIVPVDKGRSEPQPFLASPFTETAAVFPPEGQYVAYVSNERDRRF